ncbi:MAG TPA: glycosyl hydrolase 115 family protein, partial [Chitinophagaceae bacterium]
MPTKLASLYRWLMSVSFLLMLLPAGAQDSTAFAIGFSYRPSDFPLAGKGKAATIYVEPGTAKVVSIAATALQQDIKEVSGIRPALQNQLPATGGYAVIIGTLGNGGWVDDLSKKGKLHSAVINGKWESFIISVVNEPFAGIPQALVIAGSDPRGTAFGVFELSRIMGVSPWTWWADVHPARYTEMYVAPASYVQGPPSVKYRGIFLNDEDWGLQPWAARKMDTDVKDI